MSRIDCSPVLGGNGGDGRVPAAIENLAVPKAVASCDRGAVAAGRDTGTGRKPQL
jgi:hypothetical protein